MSSRVPILPHHIHLMHVATDVDDEVGVGPLGKVVLRHGTGSGFGGWISE
jgi:hypothetical protein